MKKGPWLFGSYFMGGFECSTHRTLEGNRLDVIAATQHDVQARQDYQLCRAAGIKAVRESARWPILDCDGTLHLDGVRELARMGREEGVLQVWDLMHYGYPDGLDPFSGEFTARFVAFARAIAGIVREETEGPTWYTPINEISYTAWAAGDVGYMGKDQDTCKIETQTGMVAGLCPLLHSQATQIGSGRSSCSGCGTSSRLSM